MRNAGTLAPTRNNLAGWSLLIEQKFRNALSRRLRTARGTGSPRLRRIDTSRKTFDVAKSPVQDPQEVPPAPTPGQPSEPPLENPPGNPQPDIPPPVNDPAEPSQPKELPGETPDELPVRGPGAPQAPPGTA
jgi:hypothetical protein